MEIQNLKRALEKKQQERELMKSRPTKYFKREAKAGGGYKYYYTEAQYKAAKGKDEKKDKGKSKSSSTVFKVTKVGKGDSKSYRVERKDGSELKSAEFTDEKKAQAYVDKLNKEDKSKKASTKKKTDDYLDPSKMTVGTQVMVAGRLGEIASKLQPQAEYGVAKVKVKFGDGKSLMIKTSDVKDAPEDLKKLKAKQDNDPESMTDAELNRIEDLMAGITDKKKSVSKEDISAIESNILKEMTGDEQPKLAKIVPGTNISIEDEGDLEIVAGKVKAFLKKNPDKLGAVKKALGV